jgi:calcineurin-like phosphoesterase family protein
MIQFLSILKNPLTKMVFNKATEHFKHKAEKVKVIRAAEIEAAKDVDITRIKSQNNTIKDEVLMFWLIGMLTTGWFPATRENFREWVAIINDLPDSVWYLVIIVFTASFGSKVSDKLMNRKKK